MNDETRAVWSGLVRYANGEPSSDLIGLRRTVKLCLPWAVRDTPFSSMTSLLEGPIHWLGEESAKVHAQIKALLIALCAGVDKPLPWDCRDFVWQHAKNIKLDFEQPAPIPKDKQHIVEEKHLEESLRFWTLDGRPRPSLLHGYTPTYSYNGNLAAVIVHFILQEYARVQRARVSFPIFICKNPKCGKLVMPRRIGRGDFCNDNNNRCKDAAARAENPEGEFAEYQWLRRLNKKSGAQIRRILSEDRCRERFKKLKTRYMVEYTASPRCANLIQRLEKFAA